MFPIRLGTDAEFDALRRALETCEFTEAAIKGASAQGQKGWRVPEG